MEFDNFDYGDFEEDEIILDVSGSAGEIKPIARAIYKAVKAGKLNWNGFTDAPRFNPRKRYNLLLVRESGWYCMYCSPTE